MYKGVLTVGDQFAASIPGTNKIATYEVTRVIDKDMLAHEAIIVRVEDKQKCSKT